MSADVTADLTVEVRLNLLISRGSGRSVTREPIRWWSRGRAGKPIPRLTTRTPLDARGWRPSPRATWKTLPEHALTPERHRESPASLLHTSRPP